MRADKFKAYKLRMAGRSYNEIARLLKVPKSTLSTWFSDLEIPDEAQERIKKRVQEKSLSALLKRNATQTHLAESRAQKLREDAVKEVGTVSDRDLFITGITLYWAEGHKRPIVRNGKTRTYHPVSFTNSDPKLISLFVRFLKETCEVPEEKIFLSLRFFEHQDPVSLLDFWKKTAKISASRFQKVLQVQPTSGHRKRPYSSLPFGVIQVRVGSTALYHRIMGWIEGLGL